MLTQTRNRGVVYEPAPPIDAAYLLARARWVLLGILAFPPAFFLHEGAHALAAWACGFKAISLELNGVRVPALDAFWKVVDAGKGSVPGAPGAAGVETAHAVACTAAGVLASFAVLLGTAAIVNVVVRDAVNVRWHRRVGTAAASLGAVSMLRFWGVPLGAPPTDEMHLAAIYDVSVAWLVVPETAVAVFGTAWLLRRTRPSIGPVVAWFCLLVGWATMRVILPRLL